MKRSAAALALSAFCLSAAAQTAPPPQPPDYDEPILVNPGPDSSLIFPEGARIPRFMTENEKRYLADHPGAFGTRGMAPPPTGPVHCAAEYEPMQAILISWNGGSTLTAILAQMGAQITTVGDAELWVVVNSASVQTSATTSLTNAGANMSRVKFFIRTLDSIWIRDYGPRYVFEGDCRAIVDHTYNRPRPNDDAFSQWFGPQRKSPVYDIPLTHGGGNYHLSALGDSYATRLIVNENSLSEPQIIGYWQSYQNVATHLFNPFSTALDSTQHLDMWVEVYGDRGVMVSDWPVKTTQDTIDADAICDGAATYFQSQGYTVNRLPARQVSGVHYTYTNVVICNNLVLLPTYTNTTISGAGYNTDALNTWKAAWGDDGASARKVVPINCQNIIGLAGAMHCIVMHVPQSRGGTNPTAYLKTQNGGQVYTPGQQVAINWLTDDDLAVSNVDLHLSTDGGQTFPILIAQNISAYNAAQFKGAFTWTVPDVYTTKARIRVTARDASSNTGSDISDANFTINGTPCPADYNGDGFVDGIDYDLFNNDFEAGSLNADFNGDGFVDGIDYDEFNNRFEAGC